MHAMTAFVGYPHAPGLLRRLLLKEARRRASSLAQESEMASAEPAQVVRKATGAA